MARRTRRKTVETIRHEDASRRNIPTAEYQSMIDGQDGNSVQAAYKRRNRDLDPQLVWRGKDEQDLSELVVAAPPLYIQEKVHPKVLIDDLMRQTQRSEVDQLDLFGDFNGLPSENARTEFYQHDQNWSNRMILGDSLQVMASLAEREGLRGKVQCIFMDPPYGIRFNSNFQWSTTSRDVRDGKVEHLTREPEQVKAFRDTWRDGIHSYLTYLRDRLTVARDLLTESGSIFVQIGEENVHLVRTLLDEVFGPNNFVSLITYRTSSGTTQQHAVKRISDYLIWYCRDKERIKFRRLLQEREIDTGMYSQVEEEDGSRRPMTRAERQNTALLPKNSKAYTKLPVHSMASGDHSPRSCFGAVWRIPPMRSWRYAPDGFSRLLKASRIQPDKTALRAVYFHTDYPASEITNSWDDTGPEVNKTYVVQTATSTVQRCVLMTTDPGDLVLDPTCGSGTSAYVAEEWGRRWITVDTSRVALALARARLMGARYPYYLLADSKEGQRKEAEASRLPLAESSANHNVRQGFVYRRVPHITLRSIANNAEVDVIWERFQSGLDQLRDRLNRELGSQWEEWKVPRDAGSDWPEAVAAKHQQWWSDIRARQQEIDASIATHADQEYLYDQPYENNQKVRVAGPFTVESTSPHRVLMAEDEESASGLPTAGPESEDCHDFTRVVLDNLEKAGVQQVEKSGRLEFDSIQPWPGDWICAEGVYRDRGAENARAVRAGVFIGPEFGTVSRPDIVAAAREAREADFEVLVSCAFSYDAHTSELDRLGPIPILKARMNADLHMAGDLKSTGKGNLFVVFGEPDIEVLDVGSGQVQVKVNGVDVYHPNSGEIRSGGPDDIACWFVDTDYNEESFFVRQAYFLGGKDPYKALQATLKAEINKDTWATLRRATSRPFDKPQSGRIAVKVINHLGDEVMKVLNVS